MSDPLLIRAYRKEKTEKTPVWLMRQAGRYLPEYLELRSKYSINEIINNAELAAEVTRQPLRRFDLDAAIIFADLLTPLQGLGIEFDFIEKEGPKVCNPIVKPEDINRVAEFDPQKAVRPTLDAIRMLSEELAKENKPVIGFAGAPFTLSSYLIEGKSNPKLNKTKVFMFNNPEAWKDLQEKLVIALTDYLLAQVEAGAGAIQIFDSWLGGMGDEQYKEYVEPYLSQLVNNLKNKTNVPIVFFATGVAALFPEIKKLNVDCIGVDWRQSLTSANESLGNKFCLQGNLDPLLLFSDWDKIKDQLDKILEESRDLPGYVFNLGHGILPGTPVENVENLTNYIKNYEN